MGRGEGMVLVRLTEPTVPSPRGVWTIWALAAQGQFEEGLAQFGQRLSAYRATGAEEFLPYFLALLKERKLAHDIAPN